MVTARSISRFCLILAIACVCSGDINIQNPRGCNNRLREATFNRKNGNRLFDSQNNARGGHNVGEEQMYYYSGSKLQIQWANQHSCGDQNSNCEVIIQYMCGDNVRDGTTSNTPPATMRSCRNNNCDTDTRFGQHEPHEYFAKCAARERNKGLFIAKQEVRQSARSTRQNKVGTRYGYECAEEKDYYPYWGPTPWKDIAVFTNNPERCPFYQRESQNTKEKYECVFPDEYWRMRKKNKIILYGNKEDCERSKVVVGNRTFIGRWRAHSSHDIPAPDCLKSQWSRDNHQGNTIGGQFMKYEWKIPDVWEEESCVIRMRYNISTNDFDPWETNAAQNMKLLPDDIWKRFGLDEKEAKKRQYYLKGNPIVDIFGLHNRTKNFRLRLNIDTAKYGRTFQDRTHVFRILPRPKALRNEVIHNVNVRGRRGNIVQVYPSVEYDFVPNILRIDQGDMLHFQWTGSNTNPPMSDGNGQAGTDRSNVVQLAPRMFAKGNSGLNPNNYTMNTNYPMSTNNFLGLDWKKTDDLAFLERCTGFDPLLDEKEAYFDMGPQKLEFRGTYYYMSTRNNNFSNRNQKAAILVGETGYFLIDKGRSYRGFKSVTRSGRICQRWDRQTPHFHYFTPKYFKNFEVEENFCRNPLGARSRPWCYTTDVNVPWEYCDIPTYQTAYSRLRREPQYDAVSVENFPDTDEDVPLQEEL